MIEKYPQAFMKDDCVPHIPVILLNFQKDFKLLIKKNVNFLRHFFQTKNLLKKS